MASMRNIAKLANVSVGTVSRILNNDVNFSANPETVKRVKQIAQQLHYDKSSNKLNHKNSSIKIGLIVWHFHNEISSDPYFIEIERGILKEAAQWQIEVETLFNMRQPNIDWSILNKYAAILIIGNLTPSIITKAKKFNPNIILIDYYGKNLGVDIIQSDFETQTAHILDTLYQRGHRNIAFIGGYASAINDQGKVIQQKSEFRAEAYRRWMKLHNLENYIQIKLNQWGPDFGYLCAQELIKPKNHPTAIVVASDPMAAGVYKAVSDAHLHIPNDISICSFDDIETARFMSPALSSVHLDTQEMGRLAIETVKMKIASARKMPIRITCSSNLIVRDSICSILLK